MLEETVEEKEPTSTGTKLLPITKKLAKKKKKKSRKEEKGKERPYNKDSLNKLIADHHPRFPPVERHDVDRKKVDKLLQRTNNTSAGPNGIPFSLYKVTQEKYFNMWVELIQQVGEMMEFPPSFGESQLCLIPKVENIPHPDQF